MAKKNKTTSRAKKAAPDGKPGIFDGHPELKHTVAQIEREFGEGAIMPLGIQRSPACSGISTGSLSLDVALGGFGVPRGRVIEIFGPESSGKTTLALHIVAEAQKTSGIAAFIDAEHALDPSWAKKLGVDLETLLVSQPGSGEEAMHITEMLIRSNAVDVIIIDSVAALVPRKELEGEMGDSHVGLQARLMSQALRKLTGTISKTKTCVIFINQIRHKIGVFFGSPETTTGGNALKFYASLRLDIRRIDAIKSGQEIIGNRTRVKIVKNKVAPPFKQVEFDIMYGKGISYAGELLDLAVQQEIIQKSGAWFSYGDERIGQGRDNAKSYIDEHPEIAAHIEAQVRTTLDLPQLESEMLAASAASASLDDDLFEDRSPEPRGETIDAQKEQ